MAKKDFNCPICGSDDYAIISGSRHMCRGCSVLFIDPEKFSMIKMIQRKEEEEKEQKSLEEEK